MGKRIPIFLGIILVCIAIWMLITQNVQVRSLIERLDHLGYDLQLRTHVLTHSKKALNTQVAIIDIDDKSLRIEGRWPWPRSKLALLVDELRKQGAVVVAFDIFFPEKEPNIAENIIERLNTNNLLKPSLSIELKKHSEIFDEDKIFARALENVSAVLAIGFLPRIETQNQLPPPLLKLSTEDQQYLEIIRAQGYISSIASLQDAAKTGGFINAFADSDGIIRRAPLVMTYKGDLYPSLALQAVISYLGEKVNLVTPTYGDAIKLEGIEIGSKVISTDAKGAVLVPFIGKSYTFPYYSAADVLKHKIPKDALLGKILLVGTSATGLGDLQATSIESPFPGVEIQATLIHGILTSNFSYIPAWTLGANLFLIVLFGLISAFSFPYLGPRTLGTLIIVLPVALLFINNWIWQQTGLILSLLVPVLLVLVIALLNIIYGYLFETRRREHLKTIFGQYVPAKHIDEMIKTNSTFGMRGEDREMSVLFADIRSFTTISEGLSAAELVDMLNTFFTPMTEIIFNHRGTIDKYVGDLIMAFWGAPLRDKQHARHALESALEMQKKVKAMKSILAEHNWPEIKIGIGINSGTMSVGDMGSQFRRNYTVLGDAVNLASRVEGLSKYYGVDIIVTENTQQNQPKFIFRKLDKVRVKGKQQGISIYEVICYHNEATPELKDELVKYHGALEYYFSQDWNDALTMMQQLRDAHPETLIYQIYVDRINDFLKNPPPADWDGVYIHKSK